MAVRATVSYRGRVQGVGFRYTARSVAHRYDVSGYVKNITDGSVALVAEGTRDEVAAFLEALHREMHAYIQAKDIVWGAATGEFPIFGVRF